MSMFCNCNDVFAINVFVTMFLYIICNHMLVTGYVLLAFGEIACNKYTLLLLLLLNVLKNRQYLKNVYIKNNGMVVRPLCL